MTQDERAMKSGNVHQRSFYDSWLFLLSIFGILGGIYSWGYDLIEGDPSIYFSFLPHMFTSPFSFGQEGRVSFGATSPIFAGLMAAIYPFANSAQGILFIAKAAGAVVLASGVFIMALCLRLLYAKERLTMRRAVFCVLAPFVVVGSLFYHSVFLFETPLVILYAAACLFLLLSTRYSWLLVLLSFSYLVRPEIVLLQFIFGLIALSALLKQGKFGLCAMLTLLQFAPLVFYHWYMFELTGRLIPTTVESRFSRTGHYSGLIEFAYAFFSNYHYLTGFFLLTGAIFSSWWTDREFDGRGGIQWLPYFAAGLPLLLLTTSPTLPGRYFDFLMPLLIVFCGHRLARLLFDQENLGATSESKKRQQLLLPCLLVASLTTLLLTNELLLDRNFLALKIAIPIRAGVYILMLGTLLYLCATLSVTWSRVIATILVVFVNWHIFSFGPYNLNSKLDSRLDVNFGAQVDELLEADDKLLMYEIQLQYTTSRQILSMDGIVGNGEFLEFYKGTESFADALERNGVQYIGIDPFGAAPPMLRDEESRLLFEQYVSTAVGEAVYGRHFKYTKVLQNTTDVAYPMWHSIFRIDPLPSSSLVSP